MLEKGIERRRASKGFCGGRSAGSEGGAEGRTGAGTSGARSMAWAEVGTVPLDRLKRARSFPRRVCSLGGETVEERERERVKGSESRRDRVRLGRESGAWRGVECGGMQKMTSIDCERASASARRARKRTYLRHPEDSLDDPLLLWHQAPPPHTSFPLRPSHSTRFDARESSPIPLLQTRSFEVDSGVRLGGAQLSKGSVALVQVRGTGGVGEE